MFIGLENIIIRRRGHVTAVTTGGLLITSGVGWKLNCGIRLRPFWCLQLKNVIFEELGCARPFGPLSPSVPQARYT